jgi:hypothetical protein
MMNYLRALKSAIVDVVADFQCNPFDFLYEADIQAVMFVRAREKFLPEKIEMIGGYHPIERYPDDSKIKTTPVKCEYPSEQRFDIAVIDRERVEPYDRARWKERNWKNDRFWSQPLCAAVEIKYMQLGDKLQDRARGFQKDLQKLRSYSEKNPGFTGIALLFVQTDKQYSEALSGSMKRLEDTEIFRNGIYGAIVRPSNVSWYTQGGKQGQMTFN